jgi:DNA polymerase III delta subunit
MSVKVLFGDEPFIIDKKVTDIKKSIVYPEMNLSCYNEFTEAVRSAVETLPIMDEKRVIILSLNELKNDDGLLKVIKTMPTSTDFIIVAKEIDKRTSLFKYLKGQNMTFEFCKLSEPLLKKFVLDIMSEKSTKITNTAYSQMINRINYFDDPDVSLYTVSTYVRQLMFLSTVITEDEILKVVPSSSNDKVYELSKAILSGKEARAFSLALDFIDRGENIIGMLSMMLRVFRLGFKASLYSEVNKTELGALLGVPVFQFQDALSIPEESLSSILDIIQDAVNGIKNGRCEATNMFLFAIGKIFSLLYPSRAAYTSGKN